MFWSDSVYYLYVNLSSNLYTMLRQQVVSVTDLRRNTKQCFDGLEQNPKFIFMNNKIVAVLLNVEEYEALTRPDLKELPKEQVTEKMRKMAKAAIVARDEELTDI